MLLPLAAVLLFGQCKSGGGGGGNKPEAVAMAFLKSFATFDFDKTKKYCTPETQQIIDIMSSMMGMVGDAEREEFKKKTETEMKNLKKTICRIEGENAFCKVCCNEDGSESKDEPVRLKKIDGKWLVHLSKEDMNINPQ